MLVVAGGILLAILVLQMLNRLPQIIVVLFILYLIGSCTATKAEVTQIPTTPAGNPILTQISPNASDKDKLDFLMQRSQATCQHGFELKQTSVGLYCVQVPRGSR